VLLVSHPKKLLLVKSTGEDNHETTLVVPDMSAPSLVYFRCLVDTGPVFEEQAVVLCPFEDDRGVHDMNEVATRVLSQARPTRVTWLAPSTGRIYSTEPIRGSQAAASACVLKLERNARPSLVQTPVEVLIPQGAPADHEAHLPLTVTVTPQSQFFACELSGPGLSRLASR